MSFELLNRALEELQVAMNDCGSKLIIGGGFGLFLWQSQMEADESKQTLIGREAWCVARATADLDVFLETSIIASIEQLKAIRNCLDVLGYRVIEGVEYLHFEKYYSQSERVEINFLTGPVTDKELAKMIKIRRPRVRARGDVQLHAYITDEAIGLSEHLVQIGEESGNGSLFIPHPAILLIMKLHAFQDRMEKGEEEKAGHHAVDVYRILCLLDEGMFAQCKRILRESEEASVVKSAVGIFDMYFKYPEQIGFAKIKEHVLYNNNFDIETMRSVLSELLSFT